MATCFNCGAVLVWDDDYDASALGYVPEDCDPDDDYVVNCLHCPECHTEVEFRQPSNNKLKELEEEENNGE